MKFFKNQFEEVKRISDTDGAGHSQLFQFSCFSFLLFFCFFNFILKYKFLFATFFFYHFVNRLINFLVSCFVFYSVLYKLYLCLFMIYHSLIRFLFFQKVFSFNKIFLWKSFFCWWFITMIVPIFTLLSLRVFSHSLLTRFLHFIVKT